VIEIETSARRTGGKHEVDFSIITPGLLRTLIGISEAGPRFESDKRRWDCFSRSQLQRGYDMADANLAKIIEAAWEERDSLSPKTKGDVPKAVEEALFMLDSGKARVAEKINGEWVVRQWLKKAVLLSFRLNDNEVIHFGKDDCGEKVGVWGWDKVALKFAGTKHSSGSKGSNRGWSADAFQKAGFRAVPGAIVRRSAYIAPNVVLMPSFVNVGAYVDKGTMVDTWATVGSCAQIGKNVHLSGGVGIGGVLEPLQANPTIIEDNCFIGARSEVVEGVIVGEGSVLAMGVFIGASTKIVDRASGQVHIGKVPPYSVVVAGSLPGKPYPNNEPSPSLYCAVIVKTVDERTRSKTSINELLRD
jgi:2,3,4,5-tetrahydropyridine-2-carboxylate N-succinyltransferase